MSEGVMAGAIVGGFFGFLALSFLVLFLVGAFALWLSAKLLKIRDVGFVKAVGAAFVILVLSFGVSLVCSPIPILGTVLGFAASLVLSVVVLQRMFDTTTGNAIVCLLVKWFLDTVAIAGLVFAFVGGTAGLAVLFGGQ